MKKYICCILLAIVISCSEDQSIDGNTSSNIIEIDYYEWYWGKEFSVKFNIINISPLVRQISLTEEINLLQISASSTEDESKVLFEVFADSIGDNVLYNNTFDYRTGVGYGCPYNAVYIDMHVMANDDKEFVASFTGRLKHYNQWVPEYIYMDITYGSISYRY